VRTHAFGLGIEVAGSTQSADLDMRSAARTGKTAPFMVTTRQHLAGGAFGRRVVNDAVVDAVRIARAIGAPVQVVRPLGDDIRRGRVRPAAAQRIEVALDAAAEVIAWHHRVASDSVLARILPDTFEAKHRIDNTATDGLLHAYRVPHQRIAWQLQPAAPEPGFVRGVAAGTTCWAIETMIDRVARATGRDPLAWRLERLEEPRGREVLRAVAEMAHWSVASPPEVARGLAFLAFRGAVVATVAELRLAAGRPQVTRLYIAADVGLAIHPRNVAAQIEGGAIFGLSMALGESLGFTAGQTRAGGLADYPVLRADGVPEIALRLVGGETATRPAGVGEIGVPTIAPAVANALALLTGRHTDRLPLSL
jgi:isoquinoline 1-oxidoreductase beta subunit